MKWSAGILPAGARASSPRSRRIIAASAFVALTIAGACWLRLGALPPSLLDERHFNSTTLVDRNGEVLYDALSESGTRRTRLHAADIPPNVAKATIAAEDRRFYRHEGIDVLAIARALVADVRAGRVVEGGSTITQQTAKLLLSRGDVRRRGVWQKAEEGIVALRLEHRFNKSELLATYLSIAPYGNQIVGIDRASRFYFGVAPEQLTAAQAAFLAALPQRPTQLDPLRHFDAARARQQAILAAMKATGNLSARDYEIARAERVRLTRSRTPLLAPHFAAYVRELIGSNASRVETTLDSDLQRSVRGIIAAESESLKKHGAHNVAVVVLKNDTGEWLAWEGSGDYFDAESGGAIDGVRALRQPGSTLKPFTYALAFERGYDPATVLPDVQTSFATAVPGVVYAPRNYDGRTRGPLLARKALAGSINIPAVWLLSRLGAPSLLRFLRASGFSTFDRTADYYGLGLTLGDAEVRLQELVLAYSQFANGGVRVDAHAVRAVLRDGNRVAFKTQQPMRVMSPTTAYWISDVLADGDAREFIFGSGGNLDFPFPVSVKTGTSQAYRDNWTVGFTRDVTVGVWVGNFDRAPLRGSSGVTGAAPIFHSVMLAAQKKYGSAHEEVQPPLQRVRICALSGGAATIACPAVREEFLPPGRVACSWHYLKSQPNGDGTFTQVAAVELPAEFRAFAPKSDEPDTRLQVARRSGDELRITSPPDGASYSIDPTLRREFQAVSLRASTTRSGTLEWHIDGKPFRRVSAREPAHWPLTRGAHRIEVVDDRGRRATRQIFVK